MSGACGLKRCGDREYYCAVELGLQVIGGKWKPIILYHLAGAARLRFSELKRMMPNATQKMLTMQLRELEADCLVLREVHPEVPPRVEYSLTEFGRTVLPVLERLNAWGKEFEARSGGGQPATSEPGLARVSGVRRPEPSPALLG